MDCDVKTENPTNKTSIFGILKLKTRHHSRFLNRFWRHHQRNKQQSTHVSSYVRLNASHKNIASTTDNQKTEDSQLPCDSIQLQCLDVGSLLKMNERRDYKRLQYDSATETPSFAGSSLDLQWEHEYNENHQQQATYSWCNSNDDSSSSNSDENGCSIELSQITSSNTKLNQQNNNFQPVTRGTRRMRNHSIRCSSTSRLDFDNKTKSNNSWSHISTPDSLEWDVHEDDEKFKSEEDSLDRETVELLNEIEWLKNRALIETGDEQWNKNQENS